MVMLFNIITFGCKVNQYESEVMKEKMISAGFLYCDSYEKADIIIVNTCSVTNVADRKCLKEIRKIKREKPGVILVLVGCSTQNKQDVYKGLGADVLLGNNGKSKIDMLVKDYTENKKKVEMFYNDRNLEFENMMLSDFNHVRAYIKIEDGCDNFCSYCIIPYVRGSVRSKDYDLVIKEAVDLAKSGHKEIVLTGIHTGRYNSGNHTLTDLIKQLAKIEGLERIRLSSIEITELDDKFLKMMEVTPKFCNHLHIPLQAGSDEILKKMNRKYNLEYFEEMLRKIRSVRPDISITTDVIVGHPYETDELFLETVNCVTKMNFAKIHVFPFSVRQGTAAANMPEQVPGNVKKMRARKLIEVSHELEDKYYNNFKGKMLDVLIEENDNGKSVGHTSNYLKVCVDEDLKVGNIYERVI